MDTIKRLMEVSKGMPSILCDFPNCKADSNSVFETIRLSNRKPIEFNIGKTNYKCKPYIEVFDYMIRLYKWQESGNLIQDGRGWDKNGINLNLDVKSTFRKPVSFRLDPAAKRQLKILGEFF